MHRLLSNSLSGTVRLPQAAVLRASQQQVAAAATAAGSPGDAVRQPIAASPQVDSAGWTGKHAQQEAEEGAEPVTAHDQPAVAAVTAGPGPSDTSGDPCSEPEAAQRE